jgi:GNAT superfamily N-acetyltransferase
MPGLEIHLFSDEHLDGAAALLEERHRRHREAEPLLGDSYDYRAELAGLEGASGVVGVRGGRIVSFLLGLRKDDSRWGPNVWVEAACHAVEEPEDIRDLYSAAAARWVDEGRTRQYVLVPASDGALIDAWFRLSFGRQHAHGIREIPNVGWPDGARLATEDDIDELMELAPLLSDHQAESPVFGRTAPEDLDEVRKSILEDLPRTDIGDLVFEQNGRIVGAFQLAPVDLSGSHVSVARPAGSVLLSWAATLPAIRGSGAGVALTDAGFAWAREQGYETMVTDWRETNLLSSRFWPKRGFRRSFLRLYRSIP